MLVYFVRHLKTEGNYKKQYIGKTDESLFDVANQKLIDLPLNIDKVFTSPMKRCLETCELLGVQKYEIIDDLKETDFGEFEGKTYEDLKDNMHYRNYIDAKEELIYGEDRNAFKKRCITAFEKIVSEKNSTILIVCHGGTIMSIMEKFEKSQKGFYGYQISNGSGYACEFDGEKLEILSDIF